jgi:hypothetical protein
LAPVALRGVTAMQGREASALALQRFEPRHVWRRALQFAHQILEACAPASILGHAFFYPRCRALPRSYGF